MPAKTAKAESWRKALPRRLTELRRTTERRVRKGWDETMELLPPAPRKALKRLTTNVDRARHDLRKTGDRMVADARKRAERLAEEVQTRLESSIEPLISRLDANAAARPATTPTSAIRNPSPSTIRRTRPRDAPSATRTPISRVRRLTSQDITPKTPIAERHRASPANTPSRSVRKRGCATESERSSLIV